MGCDIEGHLLYSDTDACARCKRSGKELRTTAIHKVEVHVNGDVNRIANRIRECFAAVLPPVEIAWKSSVVRSMLRLEKDARRKRLEPFC